MPLQVSSLIRQAICLLILCTLFARATPAQTPPAPDTAKAQGQKLYQQGQHVAAVTVLRQAVQQTPQDAEAWFYLGLALSQMPDYSQADQAFEKAATLDKDNAIYQAHLANAHLNRQRWGKAKSYADKALKLDKQQPIAHYVNAVIALREQKYAQALTEIRTTLANSPKFALAYYTKYLILSELAIEEILQQTDVVTDEAKLRVRLQPIYQESAETLENYLKYNLQAANADALREVIVSLKTRNQPPDEAGKVGKTGYSAKEVGTKAIILSKPPPQIAYSGSRGTVEIRLFLDADGTIKYISVLKAESRELAQASIKAARGVKFVPARKDGKPVGQWVLIEYGFNI